MYGLGLSFGLSDQSLGMFGPVWPRLYFLVRIKWSFLLMYGLGWPYAAMNNFCAFLTLAWTLVSNLWQNVELFKKEYYLSKKINILTL